MYQILPIGRILFMRVLGDVLREYKYEFELFRPKYILARILSCLVYCGYF